MTTEAAGSGRGAGTTSTELGKRKQPTSPEAGSSSQSKLSGAEITAQRTAAAPEPPALRHYPIASPLLGMEETLRFFKLMIKPRFIEEPSPGQYIWELDIETVEAWLNGELEGAAINITQELDTSLMPTSPLRQMMRRFSGSAYTGPVAASRTIVDLVLLEAVSMLNGTTRRLREQTTTIQGSGRIGEESPLHFSS